MLRFQGSTSNEAQELKELGKALRKGDTATVVARHTDASLIAVLQQCQKNSPIIVGIAIAGMIFMLVFMLGSILHFWKPTIVPFTGLIGLISLFKNSVMAAKPEAWEPVKRRLERAELPTLLDALALNILPLSDAIRAGLTTQLSTATTDILEALTPAQRKQLVRFVPAQLNCSVWTRPIGPIQPLSAEKVQAATVGLLALATLRQTGAETLDWRGVDRVTSNLMAAHDEYLASLSRA